MANREDISDVQKAIGFLAVCVIVLFFIFSYWYREKKVDYICEHGIWTILHITGKGSSWYGYGYKVYYKFQYNNQTYKKMAIMSDKNAIPNKRFFVKIAIEPDEEPMSLISDTVPDWFTLEPPPEGWKRRPTVRKMRRLMVEDSLRRGLKEEVKRDW